LVNVAAHYDYVILTAGNANHALLIIGINVDNNYLKKINKNSQYFVASPL